ncbi:NAD(P)-binding domain-containing protein [Paracoccus cavernae]|uniref:NAD(P)-binding domain-containing protein n=1 Tax=Paracoccus cavernae TaxID=1571207 RepID=A0ABT8D9M0_9RHOB|nr:NAD(P)-binding domain-containing protein [Paracoccus cavernae]
MQTNESAAPARARIIRKTEIVVIGAGQAGLSSAYWLKRLGLEAGTGFAVLDANPQAGGAWQHRWPTLTLSTVNAVHDLPGLAFADVVDQGQREVKAAEAVPRYFARYEALYALPVLRPQRVRVVCPRGERFRVETDGPAFSARGIINATGTWENPNIPEIPGADRFGGASCTAMTIAAPRNLRACGLRSSGRVSRRCSISPRSRGWPRLSGSPAVRRCSARTNSPPMQAARPWPWWKSASGKGWSPVRSSR